MKQIKLYESCLFGAYLYLGFGHRRHEYDSFHQEHNRATRELLKRFMGEQNISEPEQITPDHARAVLKAIAESEGPRIRLYREFIRRLRLFYRLRTGGRECADMTSELDAEQCREWAILYDRIESVLQQYGQKNDGTEEKDYLLVDDNLGWYKHRIEANKLELAQPVAVKPLQKLLIGYPNWEIVVALGRRFGGLVIRDDEIMDGLRRENLPKEFHTIEYEGSRSQGSRFGDIMYSGSGPF